MSAEIPIVTKSRCGILKVSDIMYISLNYRKSEIHTKGDEITVYCQRGEVEGYLDQRFSHCLKNLIINFDQVLRMDNGVISFRNGEEIRLGRNSYIKARQNFAAYMINRKKLLANV